MAFHSFVSLKGVNSPYPPNVILSTVKLRRRSGHFRRQSTAPDGTLHLSQVMADSSNAALILFPKYDRQYCSAFSPKYLNMQKK
jgi:hypothetical protein